MNTGTAANQILADALNLFFGNTSPTALTTHYFALMSVVPNKGGGGIECSGGTGPYARVSKTNNTTTYPAAAVGANVKYCGVDVVFSGLPAGTWAGIAIYSASSGGTLIGYGKFVDSNGAATTITTASGDSITLPANSGLQIVAVDPTE